jgi:FixJ family two-component response regulator
MKALTEREVEVLQQIAGGNRNLEIAKNYSSPTRRSKFTSNTLWKNSAPQIAHKP